MMNLEGLGLGWISVPSGGRIRQTRRPVRLFDKRQTFPPYGTPILVVARGGAYRCALYRPCAGTGAVIPCTSGESVTSYVLCTWKQGRKGREYFCVLPTVPE